MKFPSSFTKVTKFSKLVALAMLVFLPFIGFRLGYRYQKATLVPKPPQVIIRKEPQASLREDDINILKDKGFENPVEDIKASLLSHPELIPYEGTLGGTMYLDPNSFSLLNSAWAIVSYEDGHVGGEMILKYTITENGEITWSVIDFYLHSGFFPNQPLHLSLLPTPCF
ncbi:hypothetical protein MUP65_00835 [Patescibacteria group bacterium]|nr:hypothetical protein [Patescibacteria group bacterium]